MTLTIHYYKNHSEYKAKQETHSITFTVKSYEEGAKRLEDFKKNLNVYMVTGHYYRQ